MAVRKGAILLAVSLQLSALNGVAPAVGSQRSASGERRPADGSELVVSVAASVSDVMDELAGRYREETGVELRVNTGGSNTLARQIVEGAGVDVFLSADVAQMDVVERAGRLVPGSRTDLIANALVVIVPGDTSTVVSRAADLIGPNVRRVAMGNPASVPAGVYGRRWLETVGLWSQVSPKVVPLPTVRAALAAVQEGRADAGIVYATDARTTTAVRVALSVPDDEAPAVVYPAAAIRGDREQEAARLLAWLRGPSAMRVFFAAGFRPAPSHRAPSHREPSHREPSHSEPSHPEPSHLRTFEPSNQ